MLEYQQIKKIFEKFKQNHLKERKKPRKSILKFR